MGYRQLGAESPYDPGLYFAWGETKPRDIFRWYDYAFFEKEYTDAQGLATYTVTDIGQQISGTEYDAACVWWGNGWKMPSNDDWEELMEYCTSEYVEYPSIIPKSGLHICGPNGNSILLPLTFSPHGGVDTDVLRGEYWTATACNTLCEDGIPSSMMLHFNPADSEMGLYSNGRHDGLSIRPVISRSDMSTSVVSIDDTNATLKYKDGSISIGGYSDGCTLIVTDLSGRNISHYQASDSIFQVNVLAKGFYIATLYMRNKPISTLKFAVK